MVLRCDLVSHFLTEIWDRRCWYQKSRHFLSHFQSGNGNNGYCCSKGKFFPVFDSISVCEDCSDVEVRNRIKIYTDDSVYNGPVGYGACAAVLIPAGDIDEIHIDTKAVGN